MDCRSYHQATPLEGVLLRFISVKSATAKRGLTIAFFLVHYSADFTEHPLAGPLAIRGYSILGFNTRFRKKIVFIRNSGGGSLGAVAADAFIFLNAHLGRLDSLTNWLDPSVVDKTDPVKSNAFLDMYNPANTVPYSKEFISRYQAAQRERNQRITDWAKAELKRLNDVGIPDRIFPVYRVTADLRFNDPTIDTSNQTTPSSYLGDPAKANSGIPLFGRTTTLRTWLSMWSLQDSKCRLEPYLAELRLPTFVIQSDADSGIFPSEAHYIYDLVAAQDKVLQMVPGGHIFTYDPENLHNVINVIQEWVGQRI
ncbi:uncharacterized protein BJX67DRAFT_390067 [Aspergillus lucknowensis]|uniref:AB hydrolase-1 domain-containing protein n=1 Tax=Aspergillus lucknowensis TaxID=176173 RepID=A0ABR4LIU2_9EURO